MNAQNPFKFKYQDEWPWQNTAEHSSYEKPRHSGPYSSWYQYCHLVRLIIRLSFRGQSPRGAGWLFGHNVTKDFMNINNLDLICRAHQLVNEGIKYMFEGKLVTVWSAPNYCYRCGNVAAILSFDTAKQRQTQIFLAVPDSERVIPKQNTTPYFL